MASLTIDNKKVKGITIDGKDVKSLTIDGKEFSFGGDKIIVTCYNKVTQNYSVNLVTNNETKKLIENTNPLFVSFSDDINGIYIFTVEKIDRRNNLQLWYFDKSKEEIKEINEACKNIPTEDMYGHKEMTVSPLITLNGDIYLSSSYYSSDLEGGLFKFDKNANEFIRQISRKSTDTLRLIGRTKSLLLYTDSTNKALNFYDGKDVKKTIPLDYSPNPTIWLLGYKDESPVIWLVKTAGSGKLIIFDDYNETEIGGGSRDWTAFFADTSNSYVVKSSDFYLLDDKEELQKLELPASYNNLNVYDESLFNVDSHYVYKMNHKNLTWEKVVNSGEDIEFKPSGSFYGQDNSFYIISSK